MYYHFMNIDKNSPVPLYRQVKHYLLEYIRGNGGGPPQLPTEYEISSSLKVSKGTVKAAVKELVQEGKLKRVPGKGTFINNPLKKISFATWFSLEEYTAPPLSAAIGTYLDKKEETEIDVISIPYEKQEHQLMLMTAAGKAPNLASLVYLWLPAFTYQGALIPIDELQTEEAAENIYPSSREAASYREQQFGFTLANGPVVLFYNRDILVDVYSEPDHEISEYGDLTETLAVIHEKSEGEIIPFSIPVMDDELFFLYTVYNFLLGFGGSVIDEEGKVSFHSEQNIAAYSWLRDFILKGHIDTTHDFREVRYLFAHKKIAFSIEASWLKGIIPTLNPAFPPETLGCATLPKGPNGKSTSVLYNIILSIFKQNSSPELAAEFASHLCRDPETCRRFYTQSGLLPGYRDITEKDPVYNDIFGKVLQEQMKTAVPIPSNHQSFLLSIVFCAKASREILIGGRDPVSVLNSTAEILNEIYRR